MSKFFECVWCGCLVTELERKYARVNYPCPRCKKSTILNFLEKKPHHKASKYTDRELFEMQREAFPSGHASRDGEWECGCHDDPISCPVAQDRDLWRSRAEKAIEALKTIDQMSVVMNGSYNLGATAREYIKELESV